MKRTSDCAQGIASDVRKRADSTSTPRRTTSNRSAFHQQLPLYARQGSTALYCSCGCQIQFSGLHLRYLAEQFSSKNSLSANLHTSPFSRICLGVLFRPCWLVRMNQCQWLTRFAGSLLVLNFLCLQWLSDIRGPGWPYSCAARSREGECGRQDPRPHSCYLLAWQGRSNLRPPPRQEPGSRYSRHLTFCVLLTWCMKILCI